MGVRTRAREFGVFVHASACACVSPSVRACACKCVHACVDVCVRVSKLSVCVCMFGVCESVRVRMCARARVFLRVHAGVGVRSYARVSMRARACMFVCACICARMCCRSVPFLSRCSMLAPRAISTDTSSSCPPAQASVSAVSWLLSVCNHTSHLFNRPSNTESLLNTVRQKVHGKGHENNY